MDLLGSVVSVLSCFFLPWGNSWHSHNVGRGFRWWAVDLPISSPASFTALGAALWKLSRWERALVALCGFRHMHGWFLLWRMKCLGAIHCFVPYYYFKSQAIFRGEKGRVSPRWCARRRAPCCLCSSLLGGHLKTEWKSNKQRNSSISVMVCFGREPEVTWCLPTVTIETVLGVPWGRRMTVRRFRCLQPLSPGRVKKCLMRVCSVPSSCESLPTQESWKFTPNSPGAHDQLIKKSYRWKNPFLPLPVPLFSQHCSAAVTQ